MTASAPGWEKWYPGPCRWTGGCNRFQPLSPSSVSSLPGVCTGSSPLGPGVPETFLPVLPGRWTCRGPSVGAKSRRDSGRRRVGQCHSRSDGGRAVPQPDVLSKGTVWVCHHGFGLPRGQWEISDHQASLDRPLLQWRGSHSPLIVQPLAPSTGTSCLTPIVVFVSLGCVWSPWSWVSCPGPWSHSH